MGEFGEKRQSKNDRRSTWRGRAFFSAKIKCHIYGIVLRGNQDQKRL